VRIGIHMFTGGSVERAALKAHSAGANCFQIFSSSPRMWRASVPDPAQVKLLKAVRERHDLFPLAIHTSYLINLASADPVIREKSIDGFRGELERAETLGAEYLVTHPGNCRDRAAEEGIAAFALGLKEAADRARPRRVTVLLENTVGAGAQLGSTFEQLNSIRELASELTDLQVGYCLDTCHLFAAGFEIRTPTGLRGLVRQIEDSLGMANLQLIHCNDSKAALGSRVDRHARIGEGQIGEVGFRGLVQHPKLRTKPFILEIPVETEGDDRRNIEKLQALATRPARRRAIS
jgi:deoxyribonuclease IV